MCWCKSKDVIYMVSVQVYGNIYWGVGRGVGGGVGRGVVDRINSGVADEGGEGV